jgi:hypothetical protein
LGQGADSVLIRHAGGSWHSPEVHRYSNEDDLKRTLQESPQLLASCSEAVLFVDEFTVPVAGSVDLLGVSAKGDITLVECKLGSNPEIRRSVIGQVFAYAAGLWRMTYREFDDHFSARRKGVTVEAAVRNSLQSLDSEPWNEEQFRSNLSENLESGRFTLVIAVDQITEELKRVVPYINTHTQDDTRFLALELGIVRDGDVEVVLPSVFGLESAGEKRSVDRKNWTPADYFQRLGEYGEAADQFVRAVSDYCEKNGAIVSGGAGLTPSLNVRVPVGASQSALWRSAFYNAGPSFELNFGSLRDIVPLGTLSECANVMRSIDGVSAKYTSLAPDFRGYPAIPVVPTLTQSGASEIVIRALSVVLSALRPARVPTN